MAVTATILGVDTATGGRYYTTASIGPVAAGDTLVVLAASFWAAAVAVPSLYTQPPSQSRGVYLVGTGFQPPQGGSDCQRMTMWQIPIIGTSFTGTLTFDFGAAPQYSGVLNAPVICVLKVSGLGGMPGNQIKQWSTFNTNVPLNLNPVQDAASKVYVAYAGWGNTNSAGATWTQLTSLNGNFYLHQRVSGSLPPVYTSIATDPQTGLASRNPYTSHVGIVFELAAVDTTAPTKPTNLKLDASTATTAAISWDSVEGSDKVVYRVFKGGVLQGTSTSAQYTFTGLTPGSVYSFTVQAQDYHNNLSPVSDALSYTNTIYSSTFVTDRAQAGVSAQLYDPTGVTRLAVMPLARDINWQHELSKAGSAGFSVPVSANYPIVDGSIVKFKYKGDIRFGCIIRGESCEVATDGQRWLKFENQPGLGSVLSNALIYPDGSTATTLPKYVNAERNFGFMSREGAWYKASDWHAPWTENWATKGTEVGGTNIHAYYPPDFGYVDPSVQWISATSAGPNSSTGESEVQYFRGVFQTVNDTYPVRVFATGDNVLTLWVDGIKLIEPDNSNDWKVVKTADITLAPGVHVVSAKVENVPLVPAGNNPVAFAATVAVPMPGVEGAIQGVLFHTDSLNWMSSTTPVGWYRPSVLKQLISEAKVRGVFGFNKISVGFTDVNDSYDQPWTLPRSDFTLPVAKNLMEIAQQLTEDEFDWGFDYRNMRVLAAPRIGTDRATGASPVRLFVGHSLTGVQTSRTYAKATVVLSQSADGSWQQTFRPEDTSTERYELALDLGSASTNDTANKLALSVLRDHAYPVTTVDAASTRKGPEAYVDYDIGDTILVPGHKGVGVVPARVVSITVDAFQETVVTTPQLVVDTSSTAYVGG